MSQTVELHYSAIQQPNLVLTAQRLAQIVPQPRSVEDVLQVMTLPMLVNALVALMAV